MIYETRKEAIEEIRKLKAKKEKLISEFFSDLIQDRDTSLWLKFNPISYKRGLDEEEKSDYDENEIVPKYFEHCISLHITMEYVGDKKELKYSTYETEDNDFMYEGHFTKEKIV